MVLIQLIAFFLIILLIYRTTYVNVRSSGIAVIFERGKGLVVLTRDHGRMRPVRGIVALETKTRESHHEYMCTHIHTHI
jgi:hypothetical protein